MKDSASHSKPNRTNAPSKQVSAERSSPGGVAARESNKPIPRKAVHIPPPGPPAQNNFWQSFIRWVGVLSVTWLLPASWVALSPPFSRPFYVVQTTRTRLNSLNQSIKAYRRKYKSVPLDLTTLRAFAHADSRAFAGYDGFGQRFQYIRLSPSNYLLRSFGADGVQNTFGSAPDMGIAYWGDLPATNPLYRYNQSTPLGYYPAGLLIGSDAPHRGWVAKLFVDTDAKTRQLVVRHRRKNGLFMTAPHDRVEEFLWLPNGEQIVFTGTGSLRHRDGLYLWNLSRDEVINLVDVAERSMPMSPSARAAGFFFSLAGITQATGDEPPVVYSYFGFRHEGALAPELFFSREQTIGFAIPDITQNTTNPPVFLGKGAPRIDLKWTGPLAAPLQALSRIDSKGGSRAQREWLTLPISGETERVLLAWHHFIDRTTASPLFPYSLWILSSLYGESYELLRPVQQQDAEVLRTYGTEIARALINYPMSPSYIRALAIYNYEMLMDGKPLGQRLGRLNNHSLQHVEQLNPSLHGVSGKTAPPPSGPRDATSLPMPPPPNPEDRQETR